ncbi:MAG: arginine deiminase-related protein [Bacteroidota bacterium]
MAKQTTDTLLMVRPANFGFNPETANNNAFQSNETGLTLAQITSRAIKEFDRMVQSLRAVGIDVIVFQDSHVPIKTDAVFPNNWFTTHDDGSLFLFPMFSPNRRLERDPEIWTQLAETYHLNLDRSMLSQETEGLYLEGTGSMILDRVNKIIYACRSVRTSEELVQVYAEKIGYKYVLWTGVDGSGLAIYHTNVIMALGESIAIICTEGMVVEEEKNRILQSLESTGHKIVNLSQAQILRFAGNMLEVRDQSGQSYMVMSDSAYNSLTTNQVDVIKKYNAILTFDLTTIEYFGGGSARCMMAEIFLPKK